MQNYESGRDFVQDDIQKQRQEMKADTAGFHPAFSNLMGSSEEPVPFKQIDSS